MTSTKLAKYDPKVEGAAIALIDKMQKALAEATTIVDAKEIHTLATVARGRAISLPAYNRAAALIFGAEVAIGQMLLKQRAPNKGGPPTTKLTGPSTGPVKEPTLQEVLGARDANVAKHWAAAFRKLASTVTVDQLKQAEKLSTQYNERLTRKTAGLIVAGAWTPGRRKEDKPKRKLTDTDLWAMVVESTEAQLDALQYLKDRGSKVDALLVHSRAIAGAIRKERAA